MEINTKNLQKNAQNRVSQVNFCEFYAIFSHFLHFSRTNLCLFSFLILCFLVLALFSDAAGAAISSELDPVTFIISDVTEPPQDANTPEVTENTATSPDTDANKLLPDNLFIAAGPGSYTARRLWQARITIPKDEKSSSNRNVLQRLIEQIHGVEFQSKSPAVKPFIEVEPAAADEPNEAPSAPTVADAPEIPAEEVSAEPQEKESKSKQQAPLLYEPPSARTLQMVDKVSQQPAQLANPFELAEVMFLSGHLKQAAVFYQQALERTDCNEAGSAGNRAWILFQTANCLRENEPQAAMKMYRQLLMEYPESPWTELAKSRAKLIEWDQKDKPRKLVAEGRFEIENGVFPK
jgi:hypothetical protein